jgi:hypothetical protein
MLISLPLALQTGSFPQVFPTQPSLRLFSSMRAKIPAFVILLYLYILVLFGEQYHKVKSMCMYIYINITLGSKQSSETPFLSGGSFFIQAKSMCQLRSFDSACFCQTSLSCHLKQSLQHVYIFVYSYREISLTVQNFRTQTDTLISNHLVVFLFVGTKLIKTSITLTLT